MVGNLDEWVEEGVFRAASFRGHARGLRRSGLQPPPAVLRLQPRRALLSLAALTRAAKRPNFVGFMRSCRWFGYHFP